MLVILLAAMAIKQYYSTASVNQLRWILAPTTLAVEFVTGSQFEFESYAGYVSSDRSFVIAASCAGVNFLITAFLLLALSKLWRARTQNELAKLGWVFIPLSAVFAYLSTMVANTARIATALGMHGKSLDVGGLSANQLHRLEGILIYFGFLLLLFVVNEQIAQRRSTRFTQRRSLLRQSLFPLVIYYVTTLGVPLINSVRSGGLKTDFWEHSGFVLVAPLVLILLLSMLRFSRKFLIHTILQRGDPSRPVNSETV